MNSTKPISFSGASIHFKSTGERNWSNCFGKISVIEKFEYCYSFSGKDEEASVLFTVHRLYRGDGGQSSLTNQMQCRFGDHPASSVGQLRSLWGVNKCNRSRQQIANNGPYSTIKGVSITHMHKLING